MSRWHVYSIPPIDFGWENLATVRDTAARFGAEDAAARAEGRPDRDILPSSEAFLAVWREAQHAARDAGWDGDHRQPPVVFWLPAESEFQFGFVIKQDNNGSTFVVSPQALPHLTEY